MASKQETDGNPDAIGVPVLPPLLRLPLEVTEIIANFIPDMNDFCAFRSTCKDIHPKTFRVFGERYFSNVSVAFTSASLERLRDLSQHKNTFGISLATFPQQLTISTYRLVIGAASEITDLLEVSRDSASPVDAHAIINGIALAIDNEITRRVPGAYTFDVHPAVEQYLEAMADQVWITSSGYDVKTLAKALSAFPQLSSINLGSQTPSWGQEDWLSLAGINADSFTRTGDDDRISSNAAFALARLLKAIAKAASLRQAEKREFIVSSLHAADFDDTLFEETESRQHIKLQDLDIQPHAAEALQAAFGHLKSLRLDLNDFVDPDQLTRDVQRIRSTLGLLLCSKDLYDLELDFMDDGDVMDEELDNEYRPWQIWIGDQIISMVL